MKQEKVMALLQEASKPACSPARFNQIAFELQDATIPESNEAGDEGDRATGFRQVINDVLHDVVTNRPQALPGLFPLFALFCGDRGERFCTADVDYSLMDQQ